MELFGLTDTEHAQFDSGPVVDFLVSDIAGARAELEAAAMVELIGSRRVSPGSFGSQHFRAPDGNVYELLGPILESGD